MIQILFIVPRPHPAGGKNDYFTQCCSRKNKTERACLNDPLKMVHRSTKLPFCWGVT